MKTSPLLVLIYLTVSTLPAEEEQEAATATPNIRPAGEVVLEFEHRIEIPELERFSEDGVLEIFPGDVVHLEFQEKAGKLVNPKVVANVTDPTRTITFEMTQDESLTMLKRTTEIQQTVALDCVHRGLRSEDFSPTNLRPTEKGLASFDSWPNNVWLLRLSNIEVTSKSASEVYEEKVSRTRDAADDTRKQGPADPPDPAAKSQAD